MLAGRGLQGLAMGFIPVGISLMREVVPPAMATTAVAAMSATLGVGGAIGLPLSAWIVQTGDWHTLFWVATGLAVLVGLGSVFIVPHVHDGHEGTFDFGGAVGLAIGLVALLVGVTKGNTWGWTSGARSVASRSAWSSCWRGAGSSCGSSEPLCDLRVTARRPVLLTNIAAIAIGFGMMAQAIVFPQLLQLPEEIGWPRPDPARGRALDGARRPDDAGLRAGRQLSDAHLRREVRPRARCRRSSAAATCSPSS